MLHYLIQEIPAKTGNTVHSVYKDKLSVIFVDFSLTLVEVRYEENKKIKYQRI